MESVKTLAQQLEPLGCRFAETTQDGLLQGTLSLGIARHPLQIRSSDDGMELSVHVVDQSGLTEAQRLYMSRVQIQLPSMSYDEDTWIVRMAIARTGDLVACVQRVRSLLMRFREALQYLTDPQIAQTYLQLLGKELSHAETDPQRQQTSS